MAVTAIPISGPDGRVREWVGTNTDVEDEQRALEVAEEARERLGFLAEASRQLAASLDFERTLDTAVHLPVGRIAGLGERRPLESDGAVRRLAHAHAYPDGEEALTELWERYPLRLDDDNPIAAPLRAGRSILIAEITDESLVSAAEDEEHLSLLRRLDYGGSIAVPLLVGGDAVGALMLVRARTSPRYAPDDVELVEELARRAAVALDNARLFREAAERARASQALAFVGDGVFLVDPAGLVRSGTRRGCDHGAGGGPGRRAGGRGRDPRLGRKRGARAGRRGAARRRGAPGDAAARWGRGITIDLGRRLRRGNRVRVSRRDRGAGRREDEERLRVHGLP